LRLREVFMYRLIVSDLDGTLLRDDHALSEYTKAVIRRVVDRGTDVMLATGRIFGGGRQFARELNLNTPILACNGALIKEAEGRLLYGKPLKKSALAQIIGLLLDRGLGFHCYGEEALYTNKLIPRLIGIYAFNNELPEEERFPMLEIKPEELVKMDGIYKVLAYYGDSGNVQDLRERLAEIPGASVTISWKKSFDITADKVSKATAIDRYARERGIAPSEVLCLGDNYNDLDMLQYAGLGVAMENAVDELKAAADYVTTSNNDDGAAKAIEKLILNS
jgi:Cof subfamily protein (haloacid dehalogenase superfamily)